MSEANIQERVANNLLLLYLIRQANKKGKIEDNLKMQKLVFLSQKKFLNRKVKAFSYNFFRWHQGPFSAEVNNDLIALSSRGLVRRRWPIELTKEGRELLEECGELLEINKRFLEIVDGIASDFANLTPSQIKDYVYKMKIFIPRLREVMTVEEVPPRTLILFKPSDKRSKAKFSVDETWCATLELALDQEAVESLKQSYDDAVKGRAYEFRTL